MHNDLQTARRRFVEELGHLTQSLGAGRVIGQVFAFIYLSETPQTLENLTGELGISKGSASMTVRQLERWSALKKVWVKGDRKDYYEASEELGHIVRRVLDDVVSKLGDDSESLLSDIDGMLKTHKPTSIHAREQQKFFEKRIHILRGFRGRVYRLWNSSVVKMLLKK